MTVAENTDSFWIEARARAHKDAYYCLLLELIWIDYMTIISIKHGVSIINNYFYLNTSGKFNGYDESDFYILFYMTWFTLDWNRLTLSVNTNT